MRGVGYELKWVSPAASPACMLNWAYMLLRAVSFPNCVGIVPLRLLEYSLLRGVERRQG